MRWISLAAVAGFALSCNLVLGQTHSPPSVLNAPNPTGVPKHQPNLPGTMPTMHPPPPASQHTRQKENGDEDIGAVPNPLPSTERSDDDVPLPEQ